VSQLYLAVTGDIVMTLGRLFEVRSDPRTACFWALLSGVESHHVKDADVRPDLEKRRVAFVAEIDSFRKQIKAVDSRLAVLRNAEWAHNDLTKVGKSDIKWTEVKEMIAFAERILKMYAHAFHETDQKFVIANAGWEVADFLKWTRLDDYSAHREKARAARKAAFNEWLRQKNEGDPTVADRPPTE